MAQYAYVVARNTRAGIQVEIDKAHAEGGGLVFLPRGIYALDGAVRLKSNVHLVGVGEQTVLTIDPALGPVAYDVNILELDSGDDAIPHDIEVSKLAIRGPGTASNITRDVAGEITKGCGILAAHTEVRNVVVRACRIERMGGCGILFFTRGSHDLIANITIEACQLLQNRRPPETGQAQSYKDIFFYGARFEHLRVADNVCTFAPNASSLYGNDSGIAFVGNGHGGYVRHVRLTGNVCSGHRRHGLITNYGRLVPDGVFVTDNRCEDNGWVGIYVNTDVAFSHEGSVIISGNVCAHNGSGGLGATGAPDASIRGGIVLADAYHTIVANNLCLRNGLPGEAFAAVGRKADADTVHASGISIRGMENLVDGNLARGNRGHGIALWPGRVGRVSITNNRAIQNGRDGMLIAGTRRDGARQVLVTGNVCAGNDGHGLRGALTEEALVTANYIRDNRQGAIALERSVRRVRVEGNYVDDGGS